MDNFLKYFEQERFVRWVYTPDQETDAYWGKWFNEHPQERKDAYKARLILQQLKSREEKATSEETHEIYADIVGKLRKSSRKKTIQRFVIPFMRYAAVALIFLALGLFIMYRHNPKDDFTFDQSFPAVQNNRESQLVLSDGQKISLPSKDSKVEQKADGKIVINGIDTICSRIQPSKIEINQLIVPYGKNSSITLPDGTLAYLNAGSRLMYPAVFNGKNREVYLLGEGYFKVTHNPDSPFIVNINELRVVALGTEFNISAYPEDKTVETALITGKVVLRSSSGHFLKNDFVILPNQLAEYNKETSVTTSREVDVEQYIAWHNGYLNFQAVEMNSIIQKVERYYNIKVRLENPALGIRNITGKLVLKEDKERVLEVLASTAHVEFFKISEDVFGLK
jgi:ferric-dicitrate binding protein FerR (iron transport regulator)